MSEQKLELKRKWYGCVTFVSLNGQQSPEEIQHLIAQNQLPYITDPHYGLTLYLFRVKDDPRIMMCEQHEPLRWLNPKEQEEFNTIMGEEDLFPKIPENKALSSHGFQIIPPPSGGSIASSLLTKGSYDATKAEKLKAISSLCGYPDHYLTTISENPKESGGSSYDGGILIMGMLLGPPAIGGLLAGLLGIGLLAAGTGGAIVLGMAIGALVGWAIFLGIGALYSWYHNNQIDKQIAKEKDSYELVKELGRKPASILTDQPTYHTPPGDIFPEGQPTTTPTQDGEEPTIKKEL